MSYWITCSTYLMKLFVEVPYKSQKLMDICIHRNLFFSGRQLSNYCSQRVWVISLKGILRSKVYRSFSVYTQWDIPKKVQSNVNNRQMQSVRFSQNYSYFTWQIRKLEVQIRSLWQVCPKNEIVLQYFMWNKSFVNWHEFHSNPLQENR